MPKYTLRCAPEAESAVPVVLAAFPVGLPHPSVLETRSPVGLRWSLYANSVPRKARQVSVRDPQRGRLFACVC